MPDADQRRGWRDLLAQNLVGRVGQDVVAVVAHRGVNHPRLAAIGCAQAELGWPTINDRQIIAQLPGSPADILAHRAIQARPPARLARDTQHVFLVVATDDPPARLSIRRHCAGRARQHKAQAIARAWPAIDNIAGDDYAIGLPAINMIGHGLEGGEVPVNVG